MQISLVQAALIAVLAYLGASTWVFGVGYFTLYRPLIGGTLVGLVLGDPVRGAQIGAAINAIYLGFISTGGSLPSDLVWAGYVGTALAIGAGLDAQAALALVVPLGLIGTATYFFRMAVNAIFVHWADAFAERGDAHGVALVNLWPAQILLFILTAVPIFITVYFGAEAVQKVIPLIPQQWIAGLAVVGGMLPAVGIGMLLNYMGKRHLLPYFLIGYLLAAYLNLPIMAIALFGLAAAALHVQFAGGERHESAA
jgi:PTS system mannose-specific IIC component